MMTGRILTDFVNEADDIPRFIFNVTDEGLELLLELATNSGASHDCGKVNGEYALVLEGLLQDS